MAVIKVNGFDLDNLESLNNKYVLANGYLGIAGIMDELRQEDFAQLKINHLVKKERHRQHYISVFNPLYTLVIANGVALHPKSLAPKTHQQILDLDNGLYSRTTVYEVDDIEVKIYSERFVDQRNLSLIYSKYIVFTNKEVNLEIIQGIDTEQTVPFQDSFNPLEIENGDMLILRTKEKNTEKPLNIVCDYNKNFRFKNRNKKHDGIEKYIFKAEANREYEIIKYVAVSTDKRKNVEALSKWLNKVKKDGYDLCLQRNTEAWTKFWKIAKIDIFNNDLIERYTQYNIFQLISHRPFSDQVYVSRYGLTGKDICHDFTIDMYLFKFYLNTSYETARRMLMHRVKSLSEAQENAKKLHKKGALYTDDKDNFHINALIVINLVEYIQRTMDKSVLEAGGLTMALEISKFYLSITKANDKKTNYQVLNTHTIDNEIDEIDNNALLNSLIKDCFGKTANLVALAKVGKRKEVEAFLAEHKYEKMIDEIREVRRKLYLHQPNVNFLIQAFDKYFKTEDTLTYPDVLNLFFLYPFEFKEREKRENYLYYSKFTKPNALGNFLLALIGMDQDFEKEANKYFKAFLPLNLFDNANKYNHVQNFLDLGQSAAIYIYLIYGMARVRHDGFLVMADSLIPSDIRRLEFNLKVARNMARVKIKRNSANVGWNEDQVSIDDIENQ